MAFFLYPYNNPIYIQFSYVLIFQNMLLSLASSVAQSGCDKWLSTILAGTDMILKSVDLSSFRHLHLSTAARRRSKSQWRDLCRKQFRGKDEALLIAWSHRGPEVGMSGTVAGLKSHALKSECLALLLAWSHGRWNQNVWHFCWLEVTGSEIESSGTFIVKRGCYTESINLENFKPNLLWK